MKRIYLWALIAVLIVMLSGCSGIFNEKYVTEHTQTLIPDASFVSFDKENNEYRFIDNNEIEFSVYLTNRTELEYLIEQPLSTDYTECVIAYNADNLNRIAPEGITVEFEGYFIDLFIEGGVSLIDIADFCVAIDDAVGLDLNIFEESIYFSDAVIRAHPYDEKTGSYSESNYILILSKSSGLDYDVTFDEAYRWITKAYENVYQLHIHS